MASAIHEIDPNADTVIILRSPADEKDFASWENPAVDNLNALAKLPLNLEEEDTTVSDTDDDGVHQTSANTSTAVTPDDAIPIIPEGSVLYYLSSRHPTLASPVFKAELSAGTWCEGRKKIDGRYYITTDDWDEQAFRLLLNLLHLHSRIIPHSVSFELLAQLGVLVDYYNCGNAVEFFTSVWLREFSKTVIPGKYCRELILWLWVSYILKQDELFERATVIAITIYQYYLVTGRCSYVPCMICGRGNGPAITPTQYEEAPFL